MAPGACSGQKKPARTPAHTAYTVYINCREMSSRHCVFFIGKTFPAQPGLTFQAWSRKGGSSAANKELAQKI